MYDIVSGSAWYSHSYNHGMIQHICHNNCHQIYLTLLYLNDGSCHPVVFLSQMFFQDFTQIISHTVSVFLKFTSSYFQGTPLSYCLHDSLAFLANFCFSNTIGKFLRIPLDIRKKRGDRNNFYTDRSIIYTYVDNNVLATIFYPFCVRYDKRYNFYRSGIANIN